MILAQYGYQVRGFFHSFVNILCCLAFPEYINLLGNMDTLTLVEIQLTSNAHVAWNFVTISHYTISALV